MLVLTATPRLGSAIVSLGGFDEEYLLSCWEMAASSQMSMCCEKSLEYASYSLPIVYHCRLHSVLHNDERLVLIATAFPGPGEGSDPRVHEKQENKFWQEPSP